jgi:hypothetical protein
MNPILDFCFNPFRLEPRGPCQGSALPLGFCLRALQSSLDITPLQSIHVELTKTKIHLRLSHTLKVLGIRITGKINHQESDFPPRLTNRVGYIVLSPESTYPNFRKVRVIDRNSAVDREFVHHALHQNHSDEVRSSVILPLSIGAQTTSASFPSWGYSFRSIDNGPRQGLITHYQSWSPQPGISTVESRPVQ